MTIHQPSHKTSQCLNTFNAFIITLTLARLAIPEPLNILQPGPAALWCFRYLVLSSIKYRYIDVFTNQL